MRVLLQRNKIGFRGVPEVGDSINKETFSPGYFASKRYDHHGFETVKSRGWSRFSGCLELA